jgi:CMP-N,N'-diacetyllegionaminic acid synthase
MKYLGFIPARAGSKGIPGKNKVLLLNKPLISYTFEAADHSTLLDECHLSTDDDDIISLALNYKINSFYKRPAELSGDDAAIYDALKYHISFLKESGRQIPDNIVLLQPTSPLRSHDLIDNCIREFERSQCTSLAAVSRVLQHPYEMFCKKNGKNIFISGEQQQRQAYPDYFFITGSVYIAQLEFILSEKKFFDSDSSIYIVEEQEAVDIDVPSDIELAEFYLRKINNP